MNTTDAIRKDILRMVHASKSSHVGSCLSSVEILYTLYFRIMKTDPTKPDAFGNDRLILSKAHASAALYATLAARGFFDRRLLDKFCQNDGALPCHTIRQIVPGVETSGGSLGHGLPIGLGMCIGLKSFNSPSRVFVIMSDGECEEGSTWEAAMLASTLNMDNLTAVVDFNKLQAFGRTNEIVDMRNLAERWRVFGWDVSECDGHDVVQLESALSRSRERPKMVIAHTVKGKGVSFMEDRLEWHYKSPNDDELRRAVEEIDSRGR